MMSLFLCQKNHFSDIYLRKNMNFHALKLLSILIRINQPIGIWLLLLPTFWSVSIVKIWRFDLLIIIFVLAIGGFLMRNIGCIINDFADRNFDAIVYRTRVRPLANNQLKLYQVLNFLILNIILGITIILLLKIKTIIMILLSFPLIIIYPFLKRITSLPQVWLGFVFNWGILATSTELHNCFELSTIMIYISALFWTLGYDTIYAHQDKDDDRIIGVKSLALLIENTTPEWIIVFYSITILLLNLSGLYYYLHWSYFIFIFIINIHFISQIFLINLKNIFHCGFIFKSNRNYGLLVIWAICLSHILISFDTHYYI